MMMRGLMIAGVSMAALMGSQPAAQAQDITGMFLGLLGVSQPRPEIDYRERPALVVPPRSTLPSPQEGERRRANANWPNDPDAERRAMTGEGSAWEDRRRSNSNATRLTPQEIAAGRVATTPRGANPYIPESGDLMYNPMRQMREADARFSADQRVRDERPVGQEGPRRALTDPPPGLRQATARPARTFEAPASADDRAAGIRDFQQEQVRN
jgi:hypothetical protein